MCGGGLFGPDSVDYKHMAWDLRKQLDKAEDSTVQKDKQIYALAAFIMEEVPGEPSQNEWAISTAIRIIKEHQTNITKMRRALAACAYWAANGLHHTSNLENKIVMLENILKESKAYAELEPGREYSYTSEWAR